MNSLSPKNGGIPSFLRFGTPPAIRLALADGPPNKTKGECKVSNVSNLMKHVLAALAAMFITGTLMVNGLAQTQPEVHSVAGILA